MAKLFITEFSRLTVIQGKATAIAMAPPIAEQTPIDIGVASVESAAINAATRYVRLHAGVACSVEIGQPSTATSINVAITEANPGVVTWKVDGVTANHGLVAGDKVVFTTTGTLPTNITASTTYFVVATVTASAFSIAATSGGAAINTTGSIQAGVHTAVSTKTIVATTSTMRLATGQTEYVAVRPGDIVAVIAN